MDSKTMKKNRNTNRLRNVVIAILLGLVVWLGLGHRRAIHSQSSLKEGYVTSKENNYFVDLKDIKSSNSNVFIIESSCGTETLMNSGKFHIDEKHLVLNERQICALESTARLNTDRQIYLLHSCPLRDDFILYLPTYAEGLFHLPNVRIVRATITEVLMETPVEILYIGRGLESSRYPMEHVSDITRLSLLWWFGGTYLDLDVISVRSLGGLGSNYIGVQEPNLMNNAVINVEPDGFGHNVVQNALIYISKNFNGSSWSGNGPEALTKTILNECGINEILDFGTYCKEFKIFPSYIFYPIPYEDKNQLFDPRLGEDVILYVKNVSFVVHTWNKLSRNEAVVVGSSQAYALLAREYCPCVYADSGSVF